jgi:hypothetical protein
LLSLSIFNESNVVQVAGKRHKRRPQEKATIFILHSQR